MLRKEVIAKAMLEKTNKALNRRSRSTATELATAERIVTKTRTKQTAEDAARLANAVAETVPIDDQIPPATPTGVRVESLPRALRVTWNPPDEEEYVERTRVRITNAMSTGRVLVQEDTSGKSTTVVGLPTEEHLVEVQHVDQWGLASPYSAFVVATPAPSVADLVDLAAAEIAGKLGWANIEKLSNPQNLADDVVTSRAMATQDFAALSAWIGQAAIGDALIGSVKADKITTGELDVLIDLKVGGALRWPGGVLDDGGMTLGDLAKGANALPHTSPASWITSMDDGEEPSPASGITAFRGNTSQNFRGLSLVAQGVRGGSRQGFIRLMATIGSETPFDLISTAKIDLAASQDGGSVVSIAQDVRVERDAISIRDTRVGRNLEVSNNVSVNGFLAAEKIRPRSVGATVSGNATFSYVHGFGTTSLVVDVYELTGGLWHPANREGGMIGWAWDDRLIIVQNGYAGSRAIRIMMYETVYTAV